MQIDELKLILLHKSFGEIEAVLRDFDLASTDKFGNNIFHYYVGNYGAVQTPLEKIIQLFIDFGISISANQSKMPKRTALHIAVIKKSKDVFDILLKMGADVNIRDGYGNVPLFDAVFGYRGDGYFIETLISKGASVDIMNDYDVSPKSLAETIANYDTRKFFT
ncbi:ankyrin repeat domain-containing protein [Mucilaginibacter flavidus]|uniref:ankyrin repeat domain-containing protein n=1 Tax=Mucilaginibacter flavidus TaxID=2949309 RepID=UPI00209305E5|nr:ankyrin repeat domain-containing protein [Mucilaginibacter flavidus]MCO5946244.1 ankyrin repeat domain-containing protein [Mucilaginibacter flavidus]